MFTSSHLITIIGFIHQRQIYESGSGLSLVGLSVRLSVCLSQVGVLSKGQTGRLVLARSQ